MRRTSILKSSIFRGSLLLFLFSLGFNSCAQPQIKNDFYRGVIIKAESQNKNEAKNEARGFFEKALASPNGYIRQAAAEELADLMYDGVQLPAKTAEQIRKEAAGPWAAAFDAVEKTPDREKALAFLLSREEEEIPNKAMIYTLRECTKYDRSFFSETELGAIEGHFAVSQLRYADALNFFRVFQEDEKWPEQIPALFLQHSELINDLGRAFQYTSSGDEGTDLFLQWEKKLVYGPDASVPRFRLLFFAARIARRRGQIDQAISLFEQARPLIPLSEQTDACIWYILDSVASRNTDAVIQRLRQFIPYWYDGAYFDDILERLLRELISKNEWTGIINVFSIIQNRTAAVSVARYAWVIGRAIEEDYLNEEEKQLAVKTANIATENPSDEYMRIAYNAGDTSFYYRCLSAVVLKEPFLVFGEEALAEKPSAALEFLLGFFSNGASEFVLPYIKLMENGLTPGELSALADALGKNGKYADSMRLVSLYIKGEGYTPVRQDMELFFPLPFRELTEKYAAETGIDPALLFGLIRTESAFQSGVVSHAGAVGLTQLMPATAEETADRIRRSGGPDYIDPDSEELDLSDPAVNIHIGAYYLNYLMGRFEQNTLLSLLAYNGGMNRVRRWFAANTMPTDLFLETVSIYETREYGRKVMAAAAVYRELYYRE